MGGDGLQTQRSKSWIPGKISAEEVLSDAITVDDQKEWQCKFCSRWRCRRCFSNIPAGLQGKHQKAVSAKNKELYSGSSSSSGGGERRPSDQEEELKKLRAQVELLSKQQSAWKGQEAEGVPMRRGSGLEEDCKIGGDGLQEKVG